MQSELDRRASALRVLGVSVGHNNVQTRPEPFRRFFLASEMPFYPNATQPNIGSGTDPETILLLLGTLRT